ncbi:hypothetical protein HK405_006342 [Cladochytrium tenue]|nr:hypothetical protein HK405_006342 [Cladochytrium tenue]
MDTRAAGSDTAAVVGKAVVDSDLQAAVAVAAPPSPAAIGGLVGLALPPHSLMSCAAPHPPPVAAATEPLRDLSSLVAAGLSLEDENSLFDRLLPFSTESSPASAPAGNNGGDLHEELSRLHSDKLRRDAQIVQLQRELGDLKASLLFNGLSGAATASTLSLRRCASDPPAAIVAATAPTPSYFSVAVEDALRARLSCTSDPSGTICDNRPLTQQPATAAPIGLPRPPTAASPSTASCSATSDAGAPEPRPASASNAAVGHEVDFDVPISSRQRTRQAVSAGCAAAPPPILTGLSIWAVDGGASMSPFPGLTELTTPTDLVGSLSAPLSTASACAFDIAWADGEDAACDARVNDTVYEPEKAFWIDYPAGCKALLERILLTNDQVSSLTLQEVVKSGTPEEKRVVVETACVPALALMRNRFGNFLIQRCLEFAAADQVRRIADRMCGQVASLSCDRFACHVVQKAFDVCDDKVKLALVNELVQVVPETITHRFACHVWQRVFETSWATTRPGASGSGSGPRACIARAVDRALRGQWQRVACDENGSLVVQCILVSCADDLYGCRVVDEIVAHAVEVSKGQWGNWVIQHLLEHGGAAVKSHILRSVARNLHAMSVDQFASKVVEKALRTCTRRELFDVVGVVLAPRPETGRPAILDMMNNQYANYVVQHVFALAEAPQRDACVRLVAPHLPILRGSRFGQRLAAVVEKFLRTPVAAAPAAVAPPTLPLHMSGPWSVPPHSSAAAAAELAGLQQSNLLDQPNLHRLPAAPPPPLPSVTVPYSLDSTVVASTAATAALPRRSLLRPPAAALGLALAPPQATLPVQLLHPPIGGTKHATTALPADAWAAAVAASTAAAPAALRAWRSAYAGGLAGY